MTLIDSVSRFIPGVLGDFASAEEDSFANGLLDCLTTRVPRYWTEKKCQRY